MYGLLSLTNVEDSGCTSLRVHLGSLLASGPALALVLHLPVKCGSRTPGLEFRCRIVSREEGYCVSWVPLGVERVACMTAAYLKTLAFNLSDEVVLVSSKLCANSVYATVFLCCLQDCRGISLLVCKLGELNVYLLMYLIIAR